MNLLEKKVTSSHLKDVSIGTGCTVGLGVLLDPAAMTFPLVRSWAGATEKHAAGQDFTSKDLRGELTAGAIGAIPVYGLVHAVQKISSFPVAQGNLETALGSIPLDFIGIGVATYALLPIVNAGYYVLQHFSKKTKDQRFYDYFSKHYWEKTKKTLVHGVAACGIFAATITMPALAPLTIPMVAGLSAWYRILMSDVKTKASKLLNPLNWIYAPLKYLGQGLSNLFSTSRPSYSPAY